MKSILFTIFLMTISYGLYAQTFYVPKNYSLVEAEDYAPYEQDILACIDWLMRTPINVNTDKRKEANAFLLKWLMGSPDVYIELKPEILTFMETTPGLALIFMGGWAKYSLETRNFDNRIEANIAGIESVIAFYNKNRQYLQKDKNVEKYIKMQRRGRLHAFVKKNV